MLVKGISCFPLNFIFEFPLQPYNSTAFILGLKFYKCFGKFFLLKILFYCFARHHGNKTLQILYSYKKVEIHAEFKKWTKKTPKIAPETVPMIKSALVSYDSFYKKWQSSLKILSVVGLIKSRKVMNIKMKTVMLLIIWTTFLWIKKSIIIMMKL